MLRSSLLATTATIVAFAISAPSFAQSAAPNPASTATVIAHRGASGYRPDHTIEGYKLAIELGADFIEPDVVATKDGVLIVRHEPMLSGTTDVAQRPEFANRKTTKKLDGVDVTDWFAGDFTLAEIKTLFAKQPMAGRDTSFDGQFRIPTLQEVIDLAKSESARLGRPIGIAPETKHPTFHQQAGIPLEDKLVGMLTAAGWTTKDAPVVIQSFEVGNLKYLNGKTDVRLAQLIDADDIGPDGEIVLAVPLAQPYDLVVAGDTRSFKDLVTPAGLKEIATYADIVAPWKPYILSAKYTDANGDGKPDDLNGDGKLDWADRTLLPPTDLVKNAHAAGLKVYTWTFRAEPRNLASNFKGDPVAEMRAYIDLGVDGVFSDFPDVAVKAARGQ
ncbi:glycerophosphodiester phosphodiesterase [Chelatococcus asaccharovorans]|uniref:glycerophosphodiester phosphodiesterase n=1 Tax=Chelatococcus asaccharovorans TaxID=28210 RepID=UPI00224C7609|nr:glycerophosphodiester phosphodiesterase [Chelatococcus asaccharovorans]CAH1672039.1 Glycerophosphoryl diester phosphodiesterase [Chelatococcus asaccharovorans]CAH1676549.1 Glycerophosphoryl diester phosphodiesterase [Chelatococcus asaccharovorans]